MGGDIGQDTPPQPLPPLEADTAAPPPRRRRAAGRPPGPLALARRGLGHAMRSWRPLLAVVIVQILFAATVVVPLQARMAPHLDHHVHAPALAGRPDALDRALERPGGLDPVVWADARRLEAALLEGLELSLFWVVVGAWLFGAVAAGGFVGTAVAGDEAPTAGRFFAHGGRHFGRMLRMGLVFLLAAYVVARLVFEAWGGAVADAEAQAATSASGWWGARLREGVFLLLFLWLRLAADLGRADLVVYARRSAFLAFFRGIGRTLRRPVASFGLALLVGVPAFGLVLLLGPALGLLRGDAWWLLLATFLVIQLAVLARWASRAALLGGGVLLVAPERAD